MINIFQPSLGKEEINELKKVFESNWLGKGEYVKNFEIGFANNLKIDPKYFLSTTSCTEAIMLSSELFQFNKNDEIIVPTISFPSIGSAIISNNAKIVFCDVDKRSLNVTALDIEKKISSKTKAVFITHYGGVPCDMDPIIDLCNKNKILIIEDSACSVKSFYKGKACGTMGDMGFWSFDAMKTLCTGDGGMIYLKSLKNRTIAEETLYLGLPVKQKSGIDSSTSNNNWWEFEMNRPGRRSIMNNITAAIGIVQLQKLEGFLKKRKKIYDFYQESFKNIDWIKRPPEINNNYVSSYYFYWIQTDRRDQLAKYLLEKGVYTTFRYWPLNKIKMFSKYTNNDQLLNTDYISKHTLNIPLHHSLSDNDISKIIEMIRNF